MSIEYLFAVRVTTWLSVTVILVGFLFLAIYLLRLAAHDFDEAKGEVERRNSTKPG